MVRPRAPVLQVILSTTVHGYYLLIVLHQATIVLWSIQVLTNGGFPIVTVSQHPTKLGGKQITQVEQNKNCNATITVNRDTCTNASSSDLHHTKARDVGVFPPFFVFSFYTSADSISASH